MKTLQKLLTALLITIYLPTSAANTEKHTPANQLLTFSLAKADNPQLLNDYESAISGDTIKILIPYLIDFKLKPTFTASAKAKVYIGDALQTSGQSIVDFSAPVHYRVVAKTAVHTYTVMVINSGLPVVYIDTKDSKPIKSKREWLDSTQLTIYTPDGQIDYHSGPGDVAVKGRGNSTWSVKAKRPYALKFSKKTALLGMAEGKRWCLLANFFDPSLFRNELANYLGQNYTNLDWTPHGQNVELVLNGVHCGNYYLCEQVRSTKTRVPGDYLIEADRKAGRGDIVGIKTGNIFNIKDISVKGKKKSDPDVIAHAKSILDRFETTLYGDDFLNPQTGYKTLIDLESFVDWLLIKELSKDFDGNMFTSCFCHIMPDSIIRMGPIWDFDLAFGGNPFGNEGGFGGFGDFFGSAGGNDMAFYNQPEGYHIAKADWFVRMFEDPEFIGLLLNKVNTMIADTATIMAYIDSSAARLALSASADTVNYYTTSSFDMGSPDDFNPEDFEDMGFGGFPMPEFDSAGGFGGFPFPMPEFDSAGGFGAFPFPMPDMDSTGGFGAFSFPMLGMDSAGGFGAFSFPMPSFDSVGGFGAFHFPMPGMDSAGGFGAFPFPMPGMDSIGGFGGDWNFGTTTTPHRSFAEEFEWIKEFISKRLLWMKRDLEERLR